MAPKRAHDSRDDEPHRVAKKPRPQRPYTRALDGQTVWHGMDPILRFLKLKHLRKNGFVNFPGKKPTIDLDESVTSIVDPLHGHSTIHPVFALVNWVGMAKSDYDKIEPGLRIASCLLNEPSVVTFFNGLLKRPLEVIEDDGHRKRLNVHCLHRFRPIDNDPPDFGRSLATVRTLIEMQQFVTWQFAILPSGVKGVSRPDKNHSAFIENQTVCTNIAISHGFFHVFNGRVDITKFPEAANHDADAALARTWFRFAAVLLHEFTHAVVLATYEQPLASTKANFEPFYCDHRISEIGWALEQAIFDGHASESCGEVLQGMGVSAPYGMTMVRFPGGVTLDAGKHAVLVSGKRWGVSGVDVAAIHMDDITKFLTKEFWEKQVPQTNGEALKLGWKVALRIKKAFGFLPDESTVLPANWYADPDVPTKKALIAAGFPGFRLHPYNTSSDESDEGDDVDPASSFPPV